MRHINWIIASLLAASCGHAHREQAVRLNGVAIVFGNGRIQVRDPLTGDVFDLARNAPDMPPEIASFQRHYTFADRCLVRLYGVKVNGTLIGPQLLLPGSFVITKKYSKAEMPSLLASLNVDALKSDRVCASV